MKIKKVRWKNFRSYGNKEQYVSFESDKGSFNLILGDNGTGKTTIIQVIEFCLFGSVVGLVNAKIPNRLNGNLWCELEFESNNQNFRIVRGMSPNILEFYVDGEQIDINANKRDFQERLESIIQIPKNVFKNIIIPNISNYKSFLSMNYKDKIQFIDNVFNLDILQQATKLIKEDVNKIKNNLYTIDGEINFYNTQLSELDEKINNNTEEGSNIDIGFLKEEINKLKKQKEKLLNSLDKADQILQEKIAVIKTTKQMTYKLQNEIDEHKKWLKSFDVDVCPVCFSNLNNENFKKHQNEIKNLLQSKESDFKNSKTILTTLESDFVEKQERVNEGNLKLNTIDKNILKFNYDIKNIKNKQKVEEELLYDNKNNLKIKLKEASDRRQELVLELQILEDLHILFTDTFRNSFLENIIPNFNSQLDNYKNFLNVNFDINLNLDMSFNLKQNFSDVTIEELSTGEKKKIEILILFSFLNLLKFQYQDLNLLFFDEMFVGLDINSIEYILKILKIISEKKNLNIFIAHHINLDQSMFDNVYETKKENQFSNLIII